MAIPNAKLGDIQKALTNLGFKISRDGNPDNLFGSRTEKALKKALIEGLDESGQPIREVDHKQLQALVDKWNPKEKEAQALKKMPLRVPQSTIPTDYREGLVEKIGKWMGLSTLHKSNDTKSLIFKALPETTLASLETAMDPKIETNAAFSAMKNFFDALRGKNRPDAKDSDLLAQFPQQVGQAITQRKKELLPVITSALPALTLTHPPIGANPSHATPVGFGGISIPVTKDVAKKERELQARVNPHGARFFGINDGATDDQGKLVRNLLFTHGHTRQLNTHVTWADAFARGNLSGLSEAQLKQADESLVRFLSRSDLNPETVSNYLEHSIDSKTRVDDVRRMAAEALVAIRKHTKSEGVTEAARYLESLKTTTQQAATAGGTNQASDNQSEYVESARKTLKSLFHGKFAEQKHETLTPDDWRRLFSSEVYQKNPVQFINEILLSETSGINFELDVSSFHELAKELGGLVKNGAPGAPEATGRIADLLRDNKASQNNFLSTFQKARNTFTPEEFRKLAVSIESVFMTNSAMGLQLLNEVIANVNKGEIKSTLLVPGNLENTLNELLERLRRNNLEVTIPEDLPQPRTASSRS